MDLIESLQQKTADENVEFSEEGGSVIDKSEEENNSGNEKLSNHGSDSTDNKVSDEQIGSLEGKRPTEESDALGEKRLEPVDGDSEVNAGNSEMEEVGEDCPSHMHRTVNQGSRKRTKTVAQKLAGKKAKRAKVGKVTESNGEEFNEDHD